MSSAIDSLSSRIQRSMKSSRAAVVLATIAGVVLLVHSSGPSAALPVTKISVQSASDYVDTPLSSATGVPPNVMFVLSRDEQLSNKAYTDYTDLDGDGVLDTTYKDNFSYAGYFDPNLCYTVSSGVWSATAKATGTNLHTCSSAWSGNFANWLTMTRMDIVRYTLFGGKRSTDTATSATGGKGSTQLQPSYLPDDVHSFAKVYAGSDIASFTPYTTYPLSFCNLSDVNSSDAIKNGYKRLIRIATGTYAQWASTESKQCDWGGNVENPQTTQTEVSVSVSVCEDKGFNESFCKPYVNGTLVSYKPTGLLQQYGDTSQLRFGLVTGTYDKPRSGGILRRNIGLISRNDTSVAANGCNTSQGDEINYKDGTFCNVASGAEGIINTIQRLQITQWPNSKDSGTDIYSDCYYGGGVPNRSNSSYKGLSFSPNTDVGANANGQNHKCTDWHTPLSEMFAEALRYIEGDAKTAAFEPDASNSIDKNLGLPIGRTWTAPYNSSNYCTSCSVIVLSTGAGTFDTDEIPTVVNLGYASADAATTALGTIEDNLGKLGKSYGDRVLGSDLIGYYGPTRLQTGNDNTGGSANGNQLPTVQEFCSARTVTDFSLVRGVCPEQPTLEGGYQLAGLAYGAWTHDLYPDSTNPTIPGIQKVQTFGVSLAESLPSLTLPTGTNKIVISPLCQTVNSSAATGSYNGTGINESLLEGRRIVASPTATNTNVNVSCAILSAAAQPFTSTASTAPTQGVTFGRPNATDGSTGTLLLVWDDGPWGGDHDRDGIEMLSWCVGTACVDSNSNNITDICEDRVFSNDGTPATSVPNTSAAVRSVCVDSTGSSTNRPSVGTSDVLVRTEMISASTSANFAMGFTANGSTADGLYRPVRRNGNGGTISNVLTGSNLSNLGTAPVVIKLSPSTGAATTNTLQNPLFYAAKYGGFSYNSTDTNPTPSTPASWDAVNNTTGISTPDGLPDNYFPVRNPALLKTQLQKALNKTLGKVGSGTAASVIASSRQGQGIVYQALYENLHPDANDGTVSASWIGDIQALFVDSQGRLREDGNGNGTLEESDLSADPVITYDTSVSPAIAQRNTGSGPVAINPLAPIKPVWSARKKLAAINGTATTALVAQRTYTSVDANKRYLFTFFDKNLDGVAQSGEQTEFISSNLTNVWGMLNSSTQASASSVLEYIRGSDAQIGTAATRNRSISYSASDAKQVMRLGDIIDSSPTEVSAPAESFDVLYNDASFGRFFSRYRQRRTVVYAGANDGMLHAFNGGFYDPSTKSYRTQSLGGSEAAHPLGTELWGYVPFNLLAHLTWLTDPQYAHVSYIDGAPRVFDAHIFTDDGDTGDHPGGWGTVMVVGFRFGGGKIDLVSPTTDALNGFGKTIAGTISTRPAYVVLDVSNPEKAPTVLAEITDPNASDLTKPQLGYTSNFPTVAAFKKTGGTEKWYLVFGNGPDNSSQATAISQAGLYVWDLATKSFVNNFMPVALPGATTSFTGDPVAVDWQLDYNADSLYVGTIGATTISTDSTTSLPVVTAQSGQLYKLDFKNSSTSSNWTVAQLVNPGNPVVGTPSVTFDESGRHFVFAGTGRYYAGADKPSTVVQSIFGVIDSLDYSTPVTPSYSSFVDTSTAVVTTDGVVANVTGATTQTALIQKVISSGGWKFTLKAAASSIAAERSTGASSVLGDTLFATAFQPSGALCTGDGKSELYGVYYKTGAPRSDAPVFGTKTVNSSVQSVRTFDLGTGIASSPGLFLNGSGGTTNVSVITQTSLGALLRTDANVSNNANSREVDWRETHPTYKQ